jgi:hypothetical protein
LDQLLPCLLLPAVRLAPFVQPYMSGRCFLRLSFFRSDSPTCEGSTFLALGFAIPCFGVFPLRGTHETHTLARVLSLPGTYGASQVLKRFSPNMPCPEDPGRPSGISPRSDSFVSASDALKPSPSAFCSNGAVPDFRRCGPPYGLLGSLCTLRMIRSPVWLLPLQGESGCLLRECSLSL